MTDTASGNQESEKVQLVRSVCSPQTFKELMAQQILDALGKRRVKNQVTGEVSVVDDVNSTAASRAKAFDNLSEFLKML